MAVTTTATTRLHRTAPTFALALALTKNYQASVFGKYSAIRSS
jgi:hypothetical protein